MVDTTALRRQMEQSIVELTARQQKVEAHLRNADREMPNDWSEAATVRENDEVLEALDSEAIERLDELRGALRRIDAGTYGVCARCGEDIVAGRLLALPSAAMCTQCAN